MINSQIRIPTAKTFPSRDCKEIGRPVGWSSCHNPWTPIRCLWYYKYYKDKGNWFFNLYVNNRDITNEYTFSLFLLYHKNACFSITCQYRKTFYGFYIIRNLSVFIRTRALRKIIMAESGKCLPWKMHQLNVRTRKVLILWTDNSYIWLLTFFIAKPCVVNRGKWTILTCTWARGSFETFCIGVLLSHVVSVCKVLIFYFDRSKLWNTSLQLKYKGIPPCLCSCKLVTED